MEPTLAEEEYWADQALEAQIDAHLDKVDRRRRGEFQPEEEEPPVLYEEVEYR